MEKYPGMKLALQKVLDGMGSLQQTDDGLFLRSLESVIVKEDSSHFPRGLEAMMQSKGPVPKWVKEGKEGSDLELRKKAALIVYLNVDDTLWDSDEILRVVNQTLNLLKKETEL